jgi:LacI family transcriptional regulator
MTVRDERLAGYLAALEEAGIAFDSSLVIESMTSYAGGATALPQLLNLTEPATAALCFNDVVAIGMMRALAAAGVAIGKDFSVIGFDDIEEAKHMLPALSTVAVNARDLGSRAAQLLMRHLASGDFEPQAVLCPTTLVLRKSCRVAGPHERGGN